MEVEQVKEDSEASNKALAKELASTQTKFIQVKMSQKMAITKLNNEVTRN